MNFIIALGQCVLAGGFAQWYFTYQKEVREVSSPLWIVCLLLYVFTWLIKRDDGGGGSDGADN